MRVDETPLEPGPIRPRGEEINPRPTPDLSLLPTMQESLAELAWRRESLGTMTRDIRYQARQGRRNVLAAGGGIDDALRVSGIGDFGGTAHELTRAKGAIQGSAGVYDSAEQNINPLGAGVPESGYPADELSPMSGGWGDASVEVQRELRRGAAEAIGAELPRGEIPRPLPEDREERPRPGEPGGPPAPPGAPTPPGLPPGPLPPSTTPPPPSPPPPPRPRQEREKGG